MKKETLQIIKNGERVLALPPVHWTLIRDRVWGKSSNGDLPLVSKSACEAEGIDPKVLQQEKPWNETNDRFILHLGQNDFGVEVLTDSEWSERNRKEFPPVTEAQRELWMIERMFDDAERLRDYPGDYFPAIGHAESKMKAWRGRYPEAAKEEDRKALIAQAEHQEHLAIGALVYDADGWLSSEDQDRRSAEFKAKANQLREKAANL